MVRRAAPCPVRPCCDPSGSAVSSQAAPRRLALADFLLPLPVDKGPDLPAVHQLEKVPLHVHIEDDDRHIPVTAEGVCRLVENLKVPGHRLVESQLVILYGGGSFSGSAV